MLRTLFFCPLSPRLRRYTATAPLYSSRVEFTYIAASTVVSPRPTPSKRSLSVGCFPPLNFRGGGGRPRDYTLSLRELGPLEEGNLSSLPKVFHGALSSSNPPPPDVNSGGETPTPYLNLPYPNGTPLFLLLNTPALDFESLGGNTLTTKGLSFPPVSSHARPAPRLH